MPPRRRTTTSSIPPFEGEGTVLDTDVVAEMESSYLDYSYSVIYSRALPDARDGLKPVHRRILYSMAESGLRPDRPYVKSARVVGDCFPAGTLVRTPQGLRCIEDLEPGDLVVAPDGDAVPVLTTYQNPVSPYVEVTLTGGQRLRATPDQLFRVVDDEFRTAWVPARALSGRRVVLGSAADDDRPRGQNADVEWAYVLGLLVAEGFPADRHRDSDRRVRIAMTDLEPLERVARWAASAGVGISRSRRRPEAGHHKLLHQVAFIHPAAYEAVRPLSASKQIPAEVLGAAALWPPFLAGLLDGDGYVRQGARELVFTTTSRGLARQVRVVLTSLGLCAHEWRTRSGDRVSEIGVSVTGRDAAVLAGLLLPWVCVRGKQQALQDALTPRRHADKLSARALPVGAAVRELTRRHRGGGWYVDQEGRAFRSRLATTGTPGVRYGRNRLGTALHDREMDVPRLLRDGWSEKLTQVGSPLGERLDLLAPHRFAVVHSVRPADDGPSYDIQVDSAEHAFLADGVVVHNCMGKYHPHGDSAIYDAMVRLAQPFAMRVPLVDGHGNWGSLDDGPAASRYTECRLTTAALLLTDGLDEETVDLEDNYDGSLQQPVVLPAAFPNLLVNGTSGIAVGMATNMVPHNLVEVVDAAVHLLEHPDATLDELMRFVPGPDLPTGGQLLGMSEVRSAYETGRGVVRMRATAELGTLPRGKSSITVTELPYGVGPERVTAKVAELAKSKKLQGINDINDYSDGSVGLQLVIEVKAGFNPQAVLAELYRLTPLEESFGINNVALVDGQPRTLGLQQLLRVFLDHRLDVVTRRSRYRLRKAQERAHLVEGLLIALDAIDEVVRIIRASRDATEARAQLVAQIGLTEVQAGHVLDMQLRRLVALEVDRLRAELAELQATMAELERILGDPAVLRAVVAEELAQVAADHGTPRRTVLVGGDLKALVTARSSALEVADDPVDVLLSSAGLLARTPVEAAEGRPSTKRHRHDVMVSAVRATARGQVGVVTSAGRVLRVGVLDLPAVPGVTTGALSLRGGAAASEFVALDKGERVLALTTYDPASPGLALATRQGVVKRVAPEWPGRLDAVEVVALRPGDEVVGAVELADGQEELVLFASTGDLLRFPAEAVRPQGRSAGGVAGIRLAPGAVVVGFAAVQLQGADTLFEEPVVVTGAGLGPERGRGPGTVSSVKVTPLSEYPRKGRATGGVRVQRLLSGEDRLVLGWAGPAPAWAAAAGGDPVELPEVDVRRDGSGSPVQRPPVAVGRPYVPRSQGGVAGR